MYGGFVGYGIHVYLELAVNMNLMQSTLLSHACASDASHANHGSLNLPAIAYFTPS
jgi:hypothetical protein